MQEGLRLVEQAVAAGAVDGLTGRNEASVDGRQVRFTSCQDEYTSYWLV
jgi:hypothetical protein